MHGRIDAFRYGLSALILVIGLAGAVPVYRNASQPTPGVLGYEEADGSVYPVMPDESKQYERDLELYGGKANLLADEFRRWIIGLFQGTSLAYMVGFMAVLVSAATFFATRGLSPHEACNGAHGKATEKDS